MQDFSKGKGCEYINKKQHWEDKNLTNAILLKTDYYQPPVHIKIVLCKKTMHNPIGIANNYVLQTNIYQKPIGPIGYIPRQNRSNRVHRHLHQSVTRHHRHFRIGGGTDICDTIHLLVVQVLLLLMLLMYSYSYQCYWCTATNDIDVQLQLPMLLMYSYSYQ